MTVPQRPGFGLTSPRASQADYLTDCAEDLARTLNQLGGATAHLVIRDGGASAALAFAERFPERLATRIPLNHHLRPRYGCPFHGLEHDPQRGEEARRCAGQ